MNRYQPRYSFGFGPTPPAILWLVIANAAVFLLHYLILPAVLQPFGLDPRETVGWIIHIFGFRPARAIGTLWLWQFVTYLFLHGGFFHILINMFVLWMFGGELERVWGTRAFLRYYFVTGIGAALFQIPFWNIPAVGASGAIYGILVAFAMLYPERRIYLYFLVPIKAKWFVLGIFILEVWAGLTSPLSGVAHLAHVGGAAVGFLYLKRAWRLREFLSELRWRSRRSRFTVIRPPDEEGRDDPDPWVH